MMTDISMAIFQDDLSYLPGELLPLRLEHPLAQEGPEPGALGHLQDKVNTPISPVPSLTGSLAQAPPLGAISTLGGGPPRPPRPPRLVSLQGRAPPSLASASPPLQSEPEPPASSRSPQPARHR